MGVDLIDVRARDDSVVHFKPISAQSLSFRGHNAAIIVDLQIIYKLQNQIHVRAATCFLPHLQPSVREPRQQERQDLV